MKFKILRCNNSVLPNSTADASRKYFEEYII